jgi:hypothetical protein
LLAAQSESIIAASQDPTGQVEDKKIN